MHSLFTFQHASGAISLDFEKEMEFRARFVHSQLTDAMLIKYVGMFGPNWRRIACLMPRVGDGWSEDAVRDRYIMCIEAQEQIESDPETQQAPPPEVLLQRTNRGWTQEEDAMLTTSLMDMRQRGNKTPWKDLSKDVFKNRRSCNAVKNRTFRLGLAGLIQTETEPNDHLRAAVVADDRCNGL